MGVTLMRVTSKRLLIIVCVLLVALLAAGSFMFLGQKRFRGLESFPATTYLETPANLQGNRYLLDAWIESQLVWREETGRILEVRPANGQAKVAVFVPAALDRNLYVGQRYRMDVRVQRGGLIHVHDLEKY
jgi:hypothetical protein